MPQLQHHFIPGALWNQLPPWRFFATIFEHCGLDLWFGLQSSNLSQHIATYHNTTWIKKKRFRSSGRNVPSSCIAGLAQEERCQPRAELSCTDEPKHWNDEKHCSLLEMLGYVWYQGMSSSSKWHVQNTFRTLYICRFLVWVYTTDHNPTRTNDTIWINMIQWHHEGRVCLNLFCHSCFPSIQPVEVVVCVLCGVPGPKAKFTQTYSNWSNAGEWPSSGRPP